MDTFQRHPGTAVSGQGDPHEAIIENILHPGRIQGRDHGIDHRIFTVMAGGGGLAGMIITEQAQHATQGRTAGQISMAQGIA